jgi:hypothetical protein
MSGIGWLAAFVANVSEFFFKEINCLSYCHHRNAIPDQFEDSA